MRALKLLPVCVVCALAAGLLAAGSAQATASEWLIEGKTFSKLALKEEKVSASGGTMSITTSLGTTVQCKKTEGSGTLSKAGIDEFTLKLFSCEVLKMAKCKVSEPLTLKTKYEPLLTGETYYAAVSPQGVATITGEGCSLPKESKVGGSVAALMSLEEFEKQPLKFSKEISKAANEHLEAEKGTPLKLTFGEFSANLEGELSLALSGEHKGDDWDEAFFTRWCKAVPSPSGVCPGAQYWPSGTSIKAVKNASMRFGIGGAAVTVCTTAKMVGQTATGIEGSAPLEAELTTFEFTGCSNACTVKVIGSSSHPVLAENYNALGDGWFDVYQFEVEIACPAQTCVYNVFRLRFNYFTTPAPELDSSPVILEKVSGPEACGAKGDWEGETSNGRIIYKVEAPSPLYYSS